MTQAIAKSKSLLEICRDFYTNPEGKILSFSTILKKTIQYDVILNFSA